MTRKHPDLPGGGRAAALYALTHRVSFEEAGAKHGVSREAVRRAWERLKAGERPVGRPPAAVQRKRWLSIRTDDGSVNMRVSDEEHAAFTRAAGSQPVSAWLRALLAKRPCPEGTPVAKHLRAIGRRAAGLPEE